MSDYRLIRSRRKTLALEISRECEVIVRAPYAMPQKKIEEFVRQHESWIARGLEKQKKRAQSRENLTEADIKELKKRARDYLPQKTEYYAKLMGVRYSGIKITSAKTRFGSCSASNSICYSYLLMLKPLSAVDYVVVHELAHTVHKNHGRQFYALIEKYLPDYKQRIKELKK
ncbi:MAG: M48 family metallopeptidase [Clostridia bacterium]|nr:M48 family metallopeptidase [Clostridia bacterium]